MKSLKLGTLNVRGLCNHKTRRKTFYWLNKLNFDIIFLQETYCKNNFVSTFDSSWKGHIVHATTDSSHSRGVCIMFREKLNVKILNSKCCDDGRILLLNVKIHDEVYCLTNICAPNSEIERKAFFTTVENWIQNHSVNVTQIIIGGDFNCCLLDNDREPKTHLRDASRKVLLDLIKNFNLTDCWEATARSNDKFTFIDKQFKTKSRLDYIFVSENINMYDSKVIVPFDTSVIDHKLVTTNVICKPCTRGPNYWKFNSEYISDKLYCENVKKLIDQTLLELSNVLNSQDLWETLKVKIKEYTIYLASKKTIARHSEIQALQEQINDLTSHDYSQNLLKLTNLKNKLNELLKKKLVAVLSDLKLNGAKREKNVTNSFLIWNRRDRVIM